jgi:drug/metabolite transporter (DMT)-like permease
MQRIGIVCVALAAALWGTDAIIRKELDGDVTPTTIVFGSHVLLVAVTLPLLLPALRAVFQAGARYVVAAVAIGAGASAVATILFTEALFHGDFITPVVIQKVQPLVAIAGAALVLGERPRRGFVWFLLPALAGFWLVNQAEPFSPTVEGLVPILQALGAAVLWGSGTVLGRFLARKLEFQQILSLRFFFGLIASAIAVPVMGAAVYVGARNSLWIGVLALVTGLLALSLYYYGLKRTPAMLASLAELTFPAVAVLAGIYAFDADLTWTQWLGVATLITVVTLLPARRRDVVDAVPAPAPTPA